MKKMQYTTLFLLLAAAQLFSQTWKTIPITSAGFSCIRSDPHHPGTVYFVGRGVIVGTSDKGRTWIYKGFSNYADNTPRDLHIDIEIPDRWYIADGAAGYMLSTNAGTSWVYKNNGLYLDYRMWEFCKIVQDYQRPNIMYMVSYERVYKSTDRGETWRSSLKPNDGREYATALVMNQRYPDSLYVFVKDGLTKRWISGDQGRSWVADSSRIGNLATHSISKDGELLVGAWRSVDYGKTWLRVKDLDIHRPPGSYLEALSSDYCVYDPVSKSYFLGSSQGLFRRNSGALIWSQTCYSLDSIGLFGGVSSVHFDSPSRTLWWFDGGRIYYSDDAVKSFNTVITGPYIASDSYLSTGDYRGGIIVGSGGKTHDNGKTWSNRWSNYTDWQLPPYGAVSPADSNFIILAGRGSISYRTEGWRKDSGYIWHRSYVSIPDPTGRFHFNPHNPHEIFGGYVTGLFRITDSILINTAVFTLPQQWVLTPRDSLGNPKKGYTYSCLAFHPTIDGIYYLCTAEEDMFGNTISTFSKTTDRGVSWTPLLDQLSYWYGDICVNPVNPEIIVIGSHHGILRSTDDGRSWTQNYGSPFQSAIITSVILDPRYPNVYYSGAESVNGDWTHWTTGLRSGGMYVSYDYGETWEALPLDGLHNVSVRFIHYHENPRRLIVSTWAGIYEMLLPEYTTNTTPLPESSTLDVRVYPNPATSGAMQTLKLLGANGKHGVVDLYSIHGRRVARVHDGVLGAETTLRQQTAQLAAGVYYYRILVGGEQRSVPVVISR